MNDYRAGLHWGVVLYTARAGVYWMTMGSLLDDKERRSRDYRCTGEATFQWLYQLVLVCMGRRWSRLLMASKDTAVITGAPVRQPFSHESNIYTPEYMEAKWQQQLMPFPITRYC